MYLKDTIFSLNHKDFRKIIKKIYVIRMDFYADFSYSNYFFFVSAYSSVSNTRTACNKQQGRPIFGLPVFLFDTLLNKNPKTVSNKAVQVVILWQNK